MEGKCTHCGASYGLHKFGSNQCPVQTKPGHKQQWAETTYFPQQRIPLPYQEPTPDYLKEGLLEILNKRPLEDPDDFEATADEIIVYFRNVLINSL